MRSRFICAFSAALLLGTTLTACGGTKVDPKTGTTASPYSSGNYPGHLKIGNPYDIAGITYYPAHDPHYTEEGVASWYGPGFHGRSTANGERFDQNGLTAAHRTLPMPSMVRVTNLENGRVAVLKVNDRGPFAKDRIIDLSKKAAQDLGVIAKGTAHVRVEYLPQETRQLIADLMRNNQLKADETTLTLLAMNDLGQGGAVASDASSGGLGFISSANAAQPVHGNVQRGVVDRAPLAPVESRSLAAPEDAGVSREEMRVARIERPAAQAAPTRSYREGGVVPAVMPENPSQMRLTPQETMPEPTAPPVRVPRELQPMPQENPAYEPLDTPDMPVPQAQNPRYEREEIAATVASSAKPSGIFIQAGSFSQAQNAHELSQRLASLGRTSVKPVDINGRTWYRVRLGPLADTYAANSTLQNMQNMGLNDARVVKD